MSIGDRVVVIDVISRRHGCWGTIIDLTKDGNLCVEFGDVIDVLSPFQVENDPVLARAALARTSFELPWVRSA